MIIARACLYPVYDHSQTMLICNVVVNKIDCMMVELEGDAAQDLGTAGGLLSLLTPASAR